MGLKKIKGYIKLILIGISKKYHHKVCKNYWISQVNWKNKIPDTHFNEIRNVIKPKKNETILDFGCGAGEFASKFFKSGFKITCCDFSETMIKKVKKSGIECKLCDDILNEKVKFDKIYMNDGFFYIYPSDRKDFLKKIYNILNDNGSFYILHEPDYYKRKKLNWGSFFNFITILFPVYQKDIGGFFNKYEVLKKTALNAGFKSVEFLDSSFGITRSHYILKK